MRILIVEDDIVICKLISSDLKKTYPNEKLEIIGPANNFKDAVYFFHIECPDVVLLDIELGTDQDGGLRLAEHINREKPIPIIFLSGMNDSLGFDLAKFTKPFAYLQKPYNKKQLHYQLELLFARNEIDHKSDEDRKLIYSNSAYPPPASLFVSTSFGELTALPLKDLVLLEADGKTIRAHLIDREMPIVFGYGGLKSFFAKNRLTLGNDFFQLSRKHIIRLSFVVQIRNNHVKLPKYSFNHIKSAHQVPIPVNGNNKKKLLALIGRNS